MGRRRRRNRKPKQSGTLSAERMGYIDAMTSIAEDFPDGAFWGFMEESGIDTDELIQFWEARGQLSRS